MASFSPVIEPERSITRARAPAGRILVFLIWKSTGIACSTSLPAQPPAPKLLGPPSMIRPEPNCCVLSGQHFHLGGSKIFARNVGQNHRIERL